MELLSRGEAERALAWLHEGPEGTGVDVGFDPKGWDRSRWVLHSVYQTEQITAEQWGAPTEVRPPYRLERNVEWEKSSWRAVAARAGADLPAVIDGRPSTDWIRDGVELRATFGLREGSMDEETLPVVLDVLAQFTTGPVYSSYASLAQPVESEDGSPMVYRGPLGEVPELATGNGGYTPSNIWPEDRSWFVFTHWDLSATRISGTPALAEALAARPDLESIAAR